MDGQPVRAGVGGRLTLVAVDVRSVARVSLAAAVCLLVVAAVTLTVLVGLDVVVGVGPRLGKFLRDANGGKAIDFLGPTAVRVYGGVALAVIIVGTAVACVAAGVANGVARWVGGIEIQREPSTGAARPRVASERGPRAPG